MTPIPAIPPIDSALKLVSQAAEASQQPSASPELAQKFQALMQRHETEVASEGHGLDAVAGLVDRQQNEIDQVQTSMQDFIEKAPSMDPSDRFIANAALMEKESVVHVKMSLAMGMTKASNKSLQTLLTNQ
jgi:type III secretion system HrpB2-like protein